MTIKADKLKSKKIQLRLSELEREYLDILTDKNKQTISDYLRYLIRREYEKL